MEFNKDSDEERIKEDEKLKVSNKRSTKRELSAYKRSATKTKQRKEENYPCAFSGNTPSRAVAPPGIWLDQENFYQRVQRQLREPNKRLFLDGEDLSMYKKDRETDG